MKKFLNEFKDFAIRGNVVDLAVGVIIGGAFSSITTSLIGDVVMPFIGMFIGGVDFSNLIIMLPSLFGGEATPMNLGNFIQTIINFVILALVVFIMVKAINKTKKKADETPAPPPAPTKEEILLTEIRDLLKENGSKP